VWSHSGQNFLKKKGKKRRSDHKRQLPPCLLSAITAPEALRVASGRFAAVRLAPLEGFPRFPKASPGGAQKGVGVYEMNGDEWEKERERMRYMSV